MRVGDAGCRITASRFHAKPNELPRSSHSIHDGQQGVQEQLSVTRSGVFDKRLAFVKLGIGEVADLERQPRGQRCQYIASFKCGLERGKLITRARRSDLLQYPASDLSIIVVGA